MKSWQETGRVAVMSVQISEIIRHKIIADFPNDYQPVADILVDECGDNLPFCQGPEYYDLIEHVRLAVLKLSRGDVDRLLRCVASAQQDWRDVLVSGEN